jgi:hypothetical protein
MGHRSIFSTLWPWPNTQRKVRLFCLQRNLSTQISGEHFISRRCKLLTSLTFSSFHDIITVLPEVSPSMSSMSAGSEIFRRKYSDIYARDLKISSQFWIVNNEWIMVFENNIQEENYCFSWGHTDRLNVALMDHLHYRLNFDLDKISITAWKSITKLVIFQSFVAKCCKMRII